METPEAHTEPIYCWGGCGMDLTSVADSDGKAGELNDIAFYLCEMCATSKRKNIPISNIGDYQVLRELKVNGFGIFYLAWHKVTGRIGALKIPKERIRTNQKLSDMFKREIRIMKTLHHPHLVRHYDDGITDDGNYYFVSEYLPEGSLANYFHQGYGGRIQYKLACSFIVQALEGLSYLHRKGYVHLDLKPENMFLKKNDKGGFMVKVGNFALAKSYLLHKGAIHKPGELEGALFWPPPEQIIDFHNVKPYTDIYSMGISLYLLITGEFPYDFPTKKKFLGMISKGKKIKDPLSIILGDDKPTPIEKKVRDIPKKLAKVINKAIEKDAIKRFNTANEFKEAIKKCLR